MLYDNNLVNVPHGFDKVTIYHIGYMISYMGMIQWTRLHAKQLQP